MEPSTPRCVTCMNEQTILQLHHATIKRQLTDLNRFCCPLAMPKSSIGQQTSTPFLPQPPPPSSTTPTHRCLATTSPRCHCHQHRPPPTAIHNRNDQRRNQQQRGNATSLAAMTTRTDNPKQRTLVDHPTTLCPNTTSTTQQRHITR